MAEVLEVQTSKPIGFKRYLPLATILIGLAAAALVLGFGLGKYQASSSTATKTTNGNTSTLRTASFSIDYPKNWSAKEYEKGEGTGAKITYRGNQVEFWLDASREPRFTDEQKKNQTAAKESDLTVDGRAAKMTVYPFKEGSSFIVVKVPASEKASSVVFWASAADEKHTKTITDIITSYKDL